MAASSPSEGVWHYEASRPARLNEVRPVNAVQAVGPHYPALAAQEAPQRALARDRSDAFVWHTPCRSAHTSGGMRPQGRPEGRAEGKWLPVRGRGRRVQAAPRPEEERAFFEERFELAVEAREAVATPRGALGGVVEGAVVKSRKTPRLRSGAVRAVRYSTANRRPRPRYLRRPSHCG